METYRRFKEDLITYYRENESRIPATALVEEHAVPLEDLYVIPPMYAYNKNFNFGPGNRAHIGQKISNKDASKRQRATVSQIFLSGDNVRYKKIYITANAGCGKTSLSRKLTMTWCQAHSPLKSLKSKYEGAELAAVKYFDILFLLHISDYQSELKCNLDDLIIQMVSKILPRNTLYNKDFLQRLLHERKCLVIVDGLDEWAHPDKCRQTPAVPHNNYPDSCTVITMSRPWKLGTIGLSEHNIDRHIEISELDVKTREQLENNAVQILNERGLNLVGKDRADFDKEVRSVQIGEIIYIPYILLQCICLFFGGLPIGKSKCEIYSNITEITLERGLKKKNLPGITLQSSDNAAVPNCMKENEICKLYISLIMKLGKLAYFALFGEKEESSLIFDSKVVTQYMTEQEIDFCLKVGLLCQTKDNSILAERRYKDFFQHKSMQEFFSAIYITSEWENSTVKLKLFNACSSLESILEMANLFVFVCGMNHEVFTCISGELQKIVDLDLIRLRTDMYTPYQTSVYWDDMRTIKSYQSMQVQCFQESVRNRNESCSIKLYDIVLDDSLTEDDLTALQTIINLFNGNVKSLNIRSPDEKIGGFVKYLDPGVFTSLETLRVEDCDKEPVWMANSLIEYSRTLKCLTISGNSKEVMSLSDISITALTGLTCLNFFYIYYANMTHSNIKRLFAYISQTATLTQLKLNSLDCLDHKDQDHRDCDITLDLRHRNEMKLLDLTYVQYRELHVNPKYLEILRLSPQVRSMTASDFASVWEDLRGAPALVSLEVHDTTSCREMILTIPTLKQLRCLKFAKMDMGDAILDLSCEMIKLERVELVEVTMSSAAWRKLILGVGVLPWGTTIILESITMTVHEWRELLLGVGVLQQSVKLKLKWCKGPSIKEWNAIMDMIKSTTLLKIIVDLNFRTHGASLSLETNIRTGLPPEIKRMDEKSVELYKQALAEGSMPDYDVRVMIVGHSNVGKTTLKKRLFNETVDITERKSTEGIEVHVGNCLVHTKSGEWIVQEKDVRLETLYQRLGELLSRNNPPSNPDYDTDEEKEHEEKHVSSSLSKGDTLVRRIVKNVKSYVLNRGWFKTKSPSHTAAQSPSHTEAQSPSHVAAQSLSLSAAQSVEPLIMSGGYETNVERNRSYRRDKELCISDLKEILHQSSKVVTNQQTSELSIWDFAGQSEFYAMHQVFLSHRAVYLLVTKLTERIDDTVDDRLIDCTGRKYKEIGDLIEFWLNSIYEYMGNDDGHDPIRQNVILVGTHADQITEIMKVSDVVDLNKALPVPLQSGEIDLFLRVHHERGNILFYGNEHQLNENIILDPQWLIDAFKSIMTSRSFCCTKQNLAKIWAEFEQTAVLQRQLIDLIWEQEGYSEFKQHSTLILCFMEKLGLIAKPYQSATPQGTQTADDYFVPYFLKRKPPVEILNTEGNKAKYSSKLCITTKSGFLPNTIFNKLLAACIQNFKPSGPPETKHIYCGCGVFDVGADCHQMCVCFANNVIHVWLSRLSSHENPDSLECKKVSDFILNILKKDLTEVVIFYKCWKDSVESKVKLFQENLLQNKGVICYCQKDGHSVKYLEITQYWQTQMQNNPDNLLASDLVLPSSSQSTSKQQSSVALSGQPFRKESDNTLMSQSMIAALHEQMKSVGVLIYKGDVMGTVFRIGSKYVMTAYHVVKCIIDPNNTRSYDFSQLDNKRNTFIHFNESAVLSDRSYTVQKLVMFNENLDVAVLEMADDGHLPPKMILAKFIFVGSDVSLIGYGNPNNSNRKHIDLRCNVVKPNSRRMLHLLQSLLQNNSRYKAVLQECGQDPSLVDIGYRGYNNESQLMFDCYMQFGASGAPMLTNNNEGDVQVVGVFTHGLPEFFFKLPDSERQKFMPFFLLEGGSKMEYIYKWIHDDHHEYVNEFFN